MKFKINDDDAVNDPYLKKFMNIYENIAAKDHFNISHIQSTELFKYSKDMIIVKPVNKGEDFICTFCGTHIGNIYGMDITGKHITETNPEQPSKLIIDLLNETLNKNDFIYLSTCISREGFREIEWHQVMIPFWRTDEIREVLCLISTEITKDYSPLLKAL
ncbi:hypothetical protein [Pseudemcibacter aquimaris]|uniref:hypothetical protein n=1 Tax=Pseudemcibacter aquimaris TaxID=2857064 RepID=UPI0020116797|nr:hypothetical protein [Pseudemcibacter aquimaris]MCC3862572.1 hypothetical protein [Pseudemcibacter aquimaris]WDU57910.1 hypothetical protein KW060_11975 [Pseudemcibacter aquimaris]